MNVSVSLLPAPGPFLSKKPGRNSASCWASAMISSVTAGFRGTRKVALSKNESGNSGTSDVSICSSVKASTRSQSVPEGLLIALAFLGCGLSHGKNANRVFTTLREGNHHGAGAKHPDADPTILAIILAVVQCGEHGRFKHFPGVGEIQAVFANVALVLLF